MDIIDIDARRPRVTSNRMGSFVGGEPPSEDKKGGVRKLAQCQLCGAPIYRRQPGRRKKPLKQKPKIPHGFCKTCRETQPEFCAFMARGE